MTEPDEHLAENQEESLSKEIKPIQRAQAVKASRQMPQMIEFDEQPLQN